MASRPSALRQPFHRPRGASENTREGFGSEWVGRWEAGGSQLLGMAWGGVDRDVGRVRVTLNTRLCTNLLWHMTALGTTLGACEKSNQMGKMWQVTVFAHGGASTEGGGVGRLAIKGCRVTT